MKRFLFGALGACLMANAAQADATCTAPRDLKALQAVALQQELMAAALTCHFTDDYNRFVTTFRSDLLQSDRAMKEFFEQRRNSEGYNAFKTRIANEASLASLRNPRFCRNAKSMFDLALQRGQADAGAAAMVQTGYRSCRPEQETPVMASAARPQQMAASSKPVGVPRSAPDHMGEAARAAPVGHVDVAAIEPTRSATVVPTASARIARAPFPSRQRATRTTSGGGVHVAALSPAESSAPPKPRATSPLPVTGLAEQERGEPEEVAEEDEAPSAAAPGEDDEAQMPSNAQFDRRHYPYIDHRRADRTAGYPGYNADEDEQADAFSSRNIPNAYRPGARWVQDGPVVADDGPPPPPWAYRHAPRPPWAYHRPRPRMVMGPDGRWYMLVPYRPVWADD